MEVIAVKVSQLICRPRVAVMTFKHINCLASWSCLTMVMWLAIGFKIWCSSIARAQHAGDGSRKSLLPIKMVTAQLLAVQGPGEWVVLGLQQVPVLGSLPILAR